MSGCNGRLGMVLMLSVLLGCLGKTPNLTVDGLGDRCGDVGVKEIVPGEGRLPLGDNHSHVLETLPCDVSDTVGNDADATDSCALNCSGKECGDNGCGGNCGECGEQKICCKGSCYPEECGITNAFGNCTGQNECLGEELICDAKEPKPESCNGHDDDCDGQTDEGFPDTNGNGIPDCVDSPTDADGDGVPDYEDNCPEHFNPNQENHDTDAMGDVCDPDDDNDSALDEEDCAPFNATVYPGAQETCNGMDDNCNGTVDEGFVDTDGDGTPDCCEPDADGIPFDEDNCPWENNVDQMDFDKDGLGDACDPDKDNDGWSDEVDCDPFDPLTHPGAIEVCDQKDNDCDGKVDDGWWNKNGDCLSDCVDFDEDSDMVPDTWDNCWGLYNPLQEDADGDGFGDACDSDDDEDDVPDEQDNCPLVFNPLQTDSDSDGVGDICTGDADGDGSPDAQDCQPLNGSAWPGAEELCDFVDNDCDGQVNEGFPNPQGLFQPTIGTCEDFDDDKDCVLDLQDNCPGLQNYFQKDLDSDGLGDACDPDRDGDNVANDEDCGPDDPTVYYGAPELPDGKDNDCDGKTEFGGQAGGCEDCNPCTVDVPLPLGGCDHVPIECAVGEICNLWGNCE